MAGGHGDIEDPHPQGGCGRLFPGKRGQHQQPARVVEFRPDASRTVGHHAYKGNKTTTTKYSLLTFLPKALFEQYRRVANIYFTLVAALSLTPYSPVRPWTTFLPLGIVLGVAMIKEAVEDYKRHRQDVEVNNRKVQVFSHVQDGFEEKTWQDINVGDVIIVHKDEFFPADVLFLGAENEEGTCYIETMQLDGETNLKIKKAVDHTKHHNQHTLGSFLGTVQCEPPNSRLYTFVGNLETFESVDAQPVVVSLGPASVLLRGCSLRNTSRVFGLVVYAGHDTKIFMNATQPPSKRSRVERTVDTIIFFMFGLLFSMCITGCAYFAWWTTHEMNKHWYLLPGRTGGATDAASEQYNPRNAGVVAITNFITAFILYGYLIPISLYVSIEMVKIIQSLVFIGKDLDMYHAESDTPAVARTSNLNEELGMVDTVLSDKTGTLTRNVMEFFKCSIGGVEYGCGVTEIERANAERQGLTLQVADADQDNPYREQYFNFYDERIMELKWAEQPNQEIMIEFFRMLALCHTVIPDGPPDPRAIRYEAESPDEAALVVAAKAFGFFFVKRGSTTVTCMERLPGGIEERVYTILNVLEFNSTRKRMSIIFRTPEGKLVLYCKGADTVIYERLDHDAPLNHQLKEVTLQHMEKFGSAGLRTLCLSYTELDEAFYDKWQERWLMAKQSLVDRDRKLEEVGEEIEKKLRLLGCTAIEDKLQEGVPQCISTLAAAGVRLWVLTGDKVETAVNIGYACNLITDEMTQFHVTGSLPEVEVLEQRGEKEKAALVAFDSLKTQLEKVYREMERDKEEGNVVEYALVIDGKALIYTLSVRLQERFLAVGSRCKAVLCCRVSPLQKAQVTALVKGQGSTTLAIGDGANDVGMIQKAHIGVGISGQEGMQAVMASDFAIAQFRFLTPLLLVHGRLSYKRITRMINFFFYKNLLFGLTIFVYNAFALFSGQPIYNDFYMTLFNVVFTAAAPLVVGWFDKDVDKKYGIKYPQLYREGQKNLYFNLRAILGWLSVAMLHALIILLIVLLGADGLEADRVTGITWGLQQNGVLMFSLVVITVHVQLAVSIDQWTWLHHFSIWGSISLWFLFLVVYGVFPITLSTDLYLLFVASVANSATFWLVLLVVPTCCVLPVYFWQQMRRRYFPARYQIVQELAKRHAKGEDTSAEESTNGATGSARGLHLSKMLERAARLVGRKGAASPGLIRQGTRRHKGYVPPYDTNSHVMDDSECRAAVNAAGYSIDSSGEVREPRRALQHTASGIARASGAGGNSVTRWSSGMSQAPAAAGGGANSQGQQEAVPMVAAEGYTYAPNPVLTQLDRELTSAHSRQKSGNMDSAVQLAAATGPGRANGRAGTLPPLRGAPSPDREDGGAGSSSGSPPGQQQQQQQQRPGMVVDVTPPGRGSPSRLGRSIPSPRAAPAVRPPVDEEDLPATMENDDPALADFYRAALFPGRRTPGPRDPA